MRPAQRLGRRLREAQIAHLALLHEGGHRANRILDGHGRIDSMLIEKIDVVGAKPLERRLAHLSHMLGPAVGAGSAAPILKPNLVATTTCPRFPAMALPTRISFSKGP